MRAGYRRGFTLIELLVAMAILAMLVLAVAQLYAGAVTAWDVGWYRARSNHIGRTIVDYISHEAEGAVWTSPDDRPQEMGYWYLNGTNPVTHAAYVSNAEGVYRRQNGGEPVPLYENDALGDEVVTLAVTFKPPDDPRTAHVEVTVTLKDKGYDDTKRYTGSVALVNRDRYRAGR